MPSALEQTEEIDHGSQWDGHQCQQTKRDHDSKHPIANALRPTLKMFLIDFDVFSIGLVGEVE